VSRPLPAPSQDVLASAAAIIAPHLDGTFRLADRAMGCATDLADCGLLKGGHSLIGLPTRDAATNTLQARVSWGPAEMAARDLDEAGLLSGGAS
jgi:hypothetical protein